jgi:methionine sulfoxide reductase catalytic subunit
MTDNESDVRYSQSRSGDVDRQIDSPEASVITAAHDDEDGDGYGSVGYRTELRLAEDIVNPETWAGGLEDKRAIAPRLRVGRDKWVNLLWLIPIGFAMLVAAVAVGKGLHNMPAVQAFIQRYPGTQVPSGVSPGIPAWVGWTHFFNLFLMMFIIRSGIQILCDHPRLYLSRNATPGKDEWLSRCRTIRYGRLRTIRLHCQGN